MQGGYQAQDQQMVFAGQMLAYQQDAELDSNEVRKLERREQRLKMTEKKAHSEMSKDESTVKGIMVVGIFNAVLLLVCLCGSAWRYKAFRGFGMKTLTLTTSLLSINVQFECGKNWLEDKVCSFFQSLNGRHSLMEFTNLSCTMGDNPCNTMKSIYYGNFIIFLTFSAAILLQLGGVLFIHFYWYKVPLPRVRQWAVWFMTAGPCLAVAGLGSWAFITPDLGDLPRGWSQLMSSYTGNSIVSYHPLNNLEYGWSFLLATASILMMYVQVFAFPCCFRAHWREELTEQEADAEEPLMETLLAEEERAEYGSLQPVGPGDAWYPAGGAQHGNLPQQPLDPWGQGAWPMAQDLQQDGLQPQPGGPGEGANQHSYPQPQPVSAVPP